MLHSTLSDNDRKFAAAFALHEFRLDWSNTVFTLSFKLNQEGKSILSHCGNDSFLSFGSTLERFKPKIAFYCLSCLYIYDRKYLIKLKSKLFNLKSLGFCIHNLLDETIIIS